VSAKVLVFNGWAAGPETWDLCSFPHDWVFSYVEQLDGLPERVMEDSDDVVLVGFSMGGAMAMRMLLKYPDKVRGAVFVSASARMMEDKATGWKGLSERRLAALKLGTDLLYGADPAPIYRADNLNRGLEFLHEHDFRQELRKAYQLPSANCPLPKVAIFQSEKDGIVRPNNAAFLKEIFPEAEVTTVPGCEHVLPVLVPGQIDAAVESVLRG
jgi:pimeloyl-ACP methyl ester carboxylesterase